MEWTIVMEGLVLVMAWFGGLGLVCAFAVLVTLATRRKRSQADAARDAMATASGEGGHGNLVVHAFEQFATKRAAGALALVLVLSSASVAFAQGNGVGNAGRLPNGKPFQILARAIQDVEAALQQQIANLQAQIDANTASISLLTQMVGSLDIAVQQLETRMSRAEASVSSLEDYVEAVDARVAFQMQLITNLQLNLSQLRGVVGAQDSAINQLFSLHNQQQGAIFGLQSSIGFIDFQIRQLTTTNNQQASQISGLQSQANSLQTQLINLNNAYINTRNQLQSGCAPGSSLRQLIPFGPVFCELDNTGGTPFSQPFSQSFFVPPGGFAGASVFCPSASPPFAATGGGVNAGVGVTVLSLGQTGNGWFAIVRNNFSSGFNASVTVTCTRIL